MEPSSLFMRACDTGRHSFGYFSVAADRKVTRHQTKQLIKKTTLFQINLTLDTHITRNLRMIHLINLIIT